MVDKKKELSDKVLKVKKKTPIIFYNSFGKKVAEAISRKAKESSISEEVLFEIYSRGLNVWNESMEMSKQQYVFARINSFINKGKTYFNEDSDLVKEDQRTSDYSWIKYRSDDGKYHWRRVRKVIDLDNSEGQQ